MSADQFICEVCREVFIDKSSLHKHQSEELCKKSFSVIKIEKKVPYKCDTCGKEFKYVGLLQKHQRSHTGENPFKCGICQRGFRYKGNLHAHQWTHKEEKPFKCSICQRDFTQKSNLYTHQLTHNKDKPFKCSICQRGFSLKCNLNAHQWTHTEEKPFKCGICQRGFTQKSNLNAHQLIHKGKKRFQCDICQKYFMHKSSLKRHMKSHEIKKSYKCDKSMMSPSSINVFEFDKLKNSLRVKSEQKDYSGNSEDLNKTNTVVLQNCEYDSTKYLFNKTNLESALVLTSKTRNPEFTFQKKLQKKENMNVSIDSSILAEQISDLENKAKNTFKTELCNKRNLVINLVPNLQTNEISTAGMKLNQGKKSPYSSYISTDVDSQFTEGMSQSSQDNLGNFYQAMDALEHKVTCTNELINEVYVKNNNIQSFEAGENSSTEGELDTCDLYPFSSYDSFEVNLNHMGHFDEDNESSDPTVDFL